MSKSKLLILSFLIAITPVITFAEAPCQSFYISTTTPETWRYSIGFFGFSFSKGTQTLKIYEKPTENSRIIVYSNHCDTGTLKPIGDFGWESSSPDELYHQFPVLQSKTSWYQIIYNIEKDEKGWIFGPEYIEVDVVLYDSWQPDDTNCIPIDTLLYSKTLSFDVYEKPKGKKVKQIEIGPNSEVWLKKINKDWALVGDYRGFDEFIPIGWIRIRDRKERLTVLFESVDRY